MDDIRNQLAELSKKVDCLIADANRKNDYLFGLRDAIGAIGIEVTGLNLGIVLLDRKPDATRWEPNPEAIVWLDDDGDIAWPAKSMSVK